MCLHSTMGNNNWLKQSLLWENKRPGSVACEGQAWWHSKHLNSHWLLGRRPLSTSRSSPGRDRFTQPPGRGWGCFFAPTSFRWVCKVIYFHYMFSLAPLLGMSAAWNQREKALLCFQWLCIPPPSNNCAGPNSLHTAGALFACRGAVSTAHACESCGTMAQILLDTVEAGSNKPSFIHLLICLF